MFRYCRDCELNNQYFYKLTEKGIVKVRAVNINVGNIIIVNPNERLPADVIILKTLNSFDNIYIRTDQLDGETDWKLRKPVMLTQGIPVEDLIQFSAFCRIEPPR